MQVTQKQIVIILAIAAILVFLLINNKSKSNFTKTCPKGTILNCTAEKRCYIEPGITNCIEKAEKSKSESECLNACNDKFSNCYDKACKNPCLIECHNKFGSPLPDTPLQKCWCMPI